MKPNNNTKNDTKKAQIRGRIITVRLNSEEEEMLNVLKGSPYFLNVSRFVRESVRKYYDSRINKASPVKTS